LVRFTWVCHWSWRLYARYITLATWLCLII